MSLAKHTFFCADLNFGVLNETESHHASRVMRLVEDDRIYIIDGKGRKVLAKITSVGKREVGFEIEKELEVESHPLNVHVVIAPTKNIDRFTFFLEKATEMGVKEITPILSANSERKNIKQDKLVKGMISALKQSGNLYLPRLNELTPIKDVLKADHGTTQKFIAHCSISENKVPFKDQIDVDKNVIILIGPEGDFNAEEVILANENEFQQVSLGPSRLRTETAGIAACHTVYLQSYS